MSKVNKVSKVSKTSGLRLFAIVAVGTTVVMLAARAQQGDPNGAFTDEELYNAATSATTTPEELREAMKQGDALLDAVQTPIVPSTPRTRTMRLSVTPGYTPPTVQLAFNEVSSLVLTDIGGQPWPVDGWAASATAKKKDRLVVTELGKNDDRKSNILTLSSGQTHMRGSLSLKLDELDMPLVVMVSQDNHRQFDSLLEIQIQQRGPQARDSIVNVETLPAINPALIAFLNNTPPRQAQPLRFDGAADLRLWRYEDQLVIRTASTLLKPAVIAHAESMGTHIYIVDLTRVLILSVDGAMRSITVQL